MNAYQAYNETKGQHKEVLEIADTVLNEFQKRYGYVTFPSNMDSITKLYSLIQSGYSNLLWPLLKDLNYSYEFEIPYILANMDARIRCGIPPELCSEWKFFYSMNAITRIQNNYVLDTKVGTLVTTPLVLYLQDLTIQDYAARRFYYGFCHDASERFIKENPEYEAVTGLIPHQFGRKQYHSYVRQNGKVFDFANGTCIAEEEYNQVIKPIVLNTVHGYELEEAEAKLDGNEIGPEKCLLLRLAVSKQRKM